MNNRAVLIHEKHGEIEEIDLDISPMKNQIFKLLRGRQTFIGQWPDIDVVIMKAEGGVSKNENTLPRPFSNEEVVRQGPSRQDGRKLRPAGFHKGGIRIILR